VGLALATCYARAWMTTVTEAAKRLGLRDASMTEAGPEDLKKDPVLAQQFARRLALAAREIVPGVEWSLEDLRDVLDVAVLGAPDEAARVVEGRYLRKRVRTHCSFAERYSEPFALVVLQLLPEPSEGAYARAVQAVAPRLRRSDMVAIYKRRIALLLPRMSHEALGPLTERVWPRFDAAVGARVVERAPAIVFPGSDPATGIALEGTQAVLDWLEDQLRSDLPA
jgi:hypothetical protein